MRLEQLCSNMFVIYKDPMTYVSMYFICEENDCL